MLEEVMILKATIKKIDKRIPLAKGKELEQLKVRRQQAVDKLMGTV